MYGDGESAANNINNYSPLHRQQHNNQFSPDTFNHHHQQSLTPQQQQRTNGGGLTRFSSAPTSFFQTLLDHDDIITGFLASSRSDDIQQQHHHHHQQQQQQQSFFVKHETPQPAIDVDLPPSTTKNGFSGSRNSGGLLRQSSSPADFFSSLDAGSFPSYRGNPQAPHLSHNQTLPSIAEFQQHDINSGSLVGIFDKSDSYNELHWEGQRRTGGPGNEIMFGLPNELGSQNGYTANPSSGLIHQMSMPNTSSELAAMDTYLKFQDSSIPCSNTRAKRGFATHPRSIAERVRRTKISDRMRKLQQLFPDIDKQTNTAQMLDMATDYIKDLEKEVQSLKDTREKCICPKRQ